MEAVLDQRPLTHPDPELEETQQETNHIQHEHDPGRGYQLLLLSQLGEVTFTEAPITKRNLMLFPHSFTDLFSPAPTNCQILITLC